MRCALLHNKTMTGLPDWTDLRYFLELARAGTLSGASRQLKVDHTTVARRIERLETQLGSTLFDRSREGYQLTDTGTALLPHAEVMEGAILAAQDEIDHGYQATAHGVVTLDAPEIFGLRILAPVLSEVFQKHPALNIDLIVQSRFANLANREADLAVVLEPPTTGRYTVARLANFRMYLYGSQEYLRRHPPIQSKADLVHHDFVDFVQNRLASAALDHVGELGFEPRRRLCCTGMMAQCEAAAQGVGLIVAPPYAVQGEHRLVPLLTDSFHVERAFWLVAPTDLYRLQRVRVVWNLLRESVERHIALFTLAQGTAAP